LAEDAGPSHEGEGLMADEPTAATCRGTRGTADACMVLVEKSFPTIQLFLSMLNWASSLNPLSPSRCLKEGMNSKFIIRYFSSILF
jgi:hypothetical protein